MPVARLRLDGVVLVPREVLDRLRAIRVPTREEIPVEPRSGS